MQTAAVNATGLPQRTTSDRGFGAMSSEDFFKVLVTELQSQDPFEPAKTGDMISQVSQIRSIELSQTLTDTLGDLAAQQRNAGVGNLLGKFVVAEITGDDGAVREIDGIVTGIRFEPDGAATLELDSGESIAAADVTRMMTPEAAESLRVNGAQAAGAAGANASTIGTPPSPTAPAAASNAKLVGAALTPAPLDLFPWLNVQGSFTL